MKTINYFLLPVIMVCTLFLSSCADKEIKLKPATTDVSGDLEGCFKVVDKEYKPIDDLVTIEIERTDATLPFELGERELWTFGEMGESANVKVGFGIEFLDEEGNVVDKIPANEGGMLGSYDPDESVAIVKLKSGNTGTIRFQMPNSESAKVTSFRVTSAFEESEGEIVDTAELEGNFDGEMDEGSNNWDEILDEYEEFVDSYIRLAKAAKNGDTDALSEYADYMQKANSLSSKLASAGSDLTAEQLARYQKILTKMSKAAM